MEVEIKYTIQGKRKTTLMAPYWLPHCSQSTFPLVLLIARLAQSPSRQQQFPYQMSRNQITKPAQPFQALPLHPRETQGSSLKNWYFIRNFSSLSEHFLFLFQNMVSLECVFQYPFPHSSDTLKPNLSYTQTATLDKARFMIFLISGKSQRQEVNLSHMKHILVSTSNVSKQKPQ